MPGYVHTLAIERPFATGSDDEYGQPSRTITEVAEVPGLIQPKTQREVVLATQAGAAIGDHTIFMARQTLTTADRLRDVTEDQAGPIYQILGIRDFNFGGLPHLEVDALRVTSAAAGSGS